MTYAGLFIRHAIGATPTTNTGAWTASPDIIPWGTGPEDPNTFKDPANYDNGYYDHSSFYTQQPNYVYLRAKNLASGALPSRLWFYYTPSNVVTWPQNWLSSNTTVAGQSQNYVDVSPTTNGEIVVTDTPLVVVPDPVGGGQHFCLISFAENKQSNPPVSPKPSGSMGTWNDLAHFVLTHPDMGWRNVTPVSSGAGTWTEAAPLQGAAIGGGQFGVGIQCKNMPTDGHVSFSVQGPPQDGAAGSANIQDIPITSPNMRFTVPVTWSVSSYNSAVVITYKQGATPAPAGAEIGAAVDMPSTAILESHGHMMDDFALARLFEGSQATPVHHPETHELMDISVMYTVGSIPYRFDGKT